MTVRNFKNTTTVGTLTSPVASSATTFTVNTFTGTPTPPFTATLDRNLASEEVVLVTAVSGTSLTVTRGFDGTAAQAHSAGGTVEHTAGAIEYTEANQHVNATTGVHGTSGSLVGSDGSQTLFNKTLVSPVLEADPTAGDAVVAYIPVGSESRNLFRGIGSDGADKITVNASGKIATVADVSVGGNASVGGTTTLTGNATAAGTVAVTGVLTANGGVTVPVGKKVTLTDAPAATTDAANKTYVDSAAASAATSAVAPKADKTYVDGLVTSTGASRKLSYWWGSGGTFPTTGVIAGDTFTHTTYGLMMYDGTNWSPGPGAKIAGKMWRTTGFFSSALTSGSNYKLAFNGNRVRGGVAFSDPNDTLTVPLDGLYRVTVRSYFSGGTGEAQTYVVRTRSGVADLNIVGVSDFKSDSTVDVFTLGTDEVPLKANDVLYVNSFVSSASGTFTYFGQTEAFGIIASVEWTAPLLGVTAL